MSDPYADLLKEVEAEAAGPDPYESLLREVEAEPSGLPGFYADLLSEVEAGWSGQPDQPDPYEDLLSEVEAEAAVTPMPVEQYYKPWYMPEAEPPTEYRRIPEADIAAQVQADIAKHLPSGELEKRDRRAALGLPRREEPAAPRQETFGRHEMELDPAKYHQAVERIGAQRTQARDDRAYAEAYHQWERGKRKGPRPMTPREVRVQAALAGVQGLTPGTATEHLYTRGAENSVALRIGSGGGIAEAVIGGGGAMLLNLGRTAWEAGEWLGHTLATPLSEVGRAELRFRANQRRVEREKAQVARNEAREEMSALMRVEARDYEHMKAIRVLDPGELPERPFNLTFPRAWETTKATGEEALMIGAAVLQVPQAVGYVFGKTPFTEKGETIGNLGGHIADWYVKRWDYLKHGDLRRLVEESPIGTVFDLSISFSLLSKAAIKVEATALRSAIEAAEDAGRVHPLRAKLNLAASDEELVRQVRNLAESQKKAQAAGRASEATILEESELAPILKEELRELSLEERKLRAKLNEANKEHIAAEHRIKNVDDWPAGDRRRVLPKYQQEFAKHHKAGKRAEYAEEAAANKAVYEELTREADMVTWIEKAIERDALAEKLRVVREKITNNRSSTKAAADEARDARRYLELAELEIERVAAQKLSVVQIIKANAVPSIVRRSGLTAETAAWLNIRDVARFVERWSDRLNKHLTPWGALTVGNALKNRLLEYSREFGLPAPIARAFPRAEKWVRGKIESRWTRAERVEANAFWRQLLRDPDLILGELVQSEMRNAAGMLDDYMFSATELYKRIPEEHLPTVRKAIHFEHENMARDFQWVSDPKTGNIFYSVRLTRRRGGKISYEELQELQRRADIMNEYAAPLATLIRNRVTKLGVDLNIFTNPSQILERLWGPNMHPNDISIVADEIGQRIRGAALHENKLRQMGVTIEAREVALGELFTEEMIRKQKTAAAKAELKRRNLTREGGWGISTDLAEELLYGVADTVRDFQLIKAFRSMAKDPSVAVTQRYFATEIIGADGKLQRITIDARPGWMKLSDLLEDVNKKGWLRKKSPKADTAIAWLKGEDIKTKTGIGGAFGDLTDMYVHPDLGHFIKAQEKWARWHRSSQFAKLLSWFKATKTILSPATHATNFLSNGLLLAPMAGLSPWNPANWPLFKQAGREMILGKNGPMWQEFIVNGGRGRRAVGARRSEMAQQADNVAAMLHSGMIGRGKNFLQELDRARMLLQGGARKVGGVSIPKLLYRDMGRLYQSGDDYYRFTLYLKLRQRGVSIEEAIVASRKAFADYENLAGVFYYVKNFSAGIPFLSFDVRMVPRVAKWAVENPHKGALLKMFGDHWTARNMAEAGVSTEEVRAYMKHIPAYQQALHIPWVALSPSSWKKGRGKFGSVNLGKYFPGARLLPLSDEMEMMAHEPTKGQGAWEWLRRVWGGGGPYTASVFAFSGVHPWFKKDISLDEAAKVFAQTWLPNIPILPWSYAYDRIVSASKGLPRLGREEPETLAKALKASFIGYRDVEYTITELMRTADRNQRHVLKSLDDKLYKAKQKARAISEKFHKLGRSKKWSKSRISREIFKHWEKQGGYVVANIIRDIAAIKRKMMDERGIKDLRHLYDL